jgi:hypothetical protein
MTVNCLARSLTGSNQSHRLSFDGRPLFVAAVVVAVVDDNNVRTAAAAAVVVVVVVAAVVRDDIDGLVRGLEEANELSDYLVVSEPGMDDERVGGVMAVFDMVDAAAVAEGGSIPAAAAAAVEEVEHFAM